VKGCQAPVAASGTPQRWLAAASAQTASCRTPSTSAVALRAPAFPQGPFHGQETGPAERRVRLGRTGDARPQDRAGRALERGTGP
jgi:hypothetical protein